MAGTYDYLVKTVHLFFEGSDVGSLRVSSNDYLSEIIVKALSLIDLNLSSYQETSVVPLQGTSGVLAKQGSKPLFGILIMGPGPRLIDFIAFDSHDDIERRAHVSVKDRPHHKWTINGQVRKASDISYTTMNALHIILDPGLVRKCLQIISIHCNVLWKKENIKCLPPNQIRRDYLRGLKQCILALEVVFNKKEPYQRPPYGKTLPTEGDVCPVPNSSRGDDERGDKERDLDNNSSIPSSPLPSPPLPSPPLPSKSSIDPQRFPYLALMTQSDHTEPDYSPTSQSNSSSEIMIKVGSDVQIGTPVHINGEHKIVTNIIIVDSSERYALIS